MILSIYLCWICFISIDALVWTELTNLRMPPRAGHTAVAFGKNLFVFGGFTDAQNLYDDLNILNIGKLLYGSFQCLQYQFNYLHYFS